MEERRLASLMSMTAVDGEAERLAAFHA